MENRANYALIGAVTVVAFVLAMLFALWLARASIAREFAAYDVVFDGPARGIGPGTEVRFNGIRVGEVRRLFMDPSQENRVVARVRIGATWPVRANSNVRLEPIGLTGLNLIQISSTDDSSPLLQQRLGGPPPRISARGAAIDELLESSETIARNATEALAGAKDILTEANAKRLERILVNLESISARLADERGVVSQSAAAATELRASARQFSETAREVEALAAESRTALAGLNTKAGRALDAATDAAEGVGAVSASASNGALPEFAGAAHDLRRLAVTLDRLAANVERSPALASVGQQKSVVKVRP